MSQAMKQHAGRIKMVSILVIVVALLVTMRALPVDRGMNVLQSWIDSFGILAPVIFAVVYVVLTVLMAPASVLTLAAGVLFGLLWGTVIVSISSTTGAALAFLIARYVARDRVAKMARNSRGFAAIDRAIEEGGWKIVAMLRLSPAVPFNLQNYLYGLTPLRFWPYVLTSWLFMLPGTFMYVYLGYAGKAAAAGEGRTAGEWALLIVGLIATIAVTVYITRLAYRKLKEQTDIADAAASEAEKEEEMETTTSDAQQESWPWGATFAAVLAVLMIGVAACAHAYKQDLAGLFGPPPAQMQEAYDQKPAGPSFDHSTFDELVSTYVQPGGWVDYEKLKDNPKTLDAYIEQVGKAPYEKLGRDEKLALLINAYNAFTLRLILDHYETVKDDPEGIKAIPSSKRWDAKRWNIGGETYSLNNIEHDVIRQKFAEPRIHFVLVCAAYSCPPLRTEAYTAEKLEEQLEDQTVYCHKHERWYRYDAAENVVHLTKLYTWYAGDFEKTAGSVLKYVAKYRDEIARKLEADEPPGVRYLDYDWQLNSVANQPGS